MKTSRSIEVPSGSPTLADQALTLAWGAWSELGVSGWTETHGGWAIDPEPLIVFTAVLGDVDPRLRDEATDWCIRNWRYVSKTRLKNMAGTWPDLDPAVFGEFTATVGAHAGIAWPLASEPRPYSPTGRSILPPLDRPSLVWLRLRAMFGLGARTEILRFFLSEPARRAGLGEIATSTGYTKRNVAEEAEQLQRAGVLEQRTMGNRFSYGLARRAELEAFVGALPSVRPDWGAVLRITAELVALEGQAESSSLRTLPVKVRAAFDRMRDDLDTVAAVPPSDGLVGVDLWPAALELAAASLGHWSQGEWPAPG